MSRISVNTLVLWSTAGKIDAYSSNLSSYASSLGVIGNAVSSGDHSSADSNGIYSLQQSAAALQKKLQGISSSLRSAADLYNAAQGEAVSLVGGSSSAGWFDFISVLGNIFPQLVIPEAGLAAIIRNMPGITYFEAMSLSNYALLAFAIGALQHDPNNPVTINIDGKEVSVDEIWATTTDTTKFVKSLKGLEKLLNGEDKSKLQEILGDVTDSGLFKSIDFIKDVKEICEIASGADGETFDEAFKNLIGKFSASEMIEVLKENHPGLEKAMKEDPKGASNLLLQAKWAANTFENLFDITDYDQTWQGALEYMRHVTAGAYLETAFEEAAGTLRLFDKVFGTEFMDRFYDSTGTTDVWDGTVNGFKEIVNGYKELGLVDATGSVIKGVGDACVQVLDEGVKVLESTTGYLFGQGYIEKYREVVGENGIKDLFNAGKEIVEISKEIGFEETTKAIYNGLEATVKDISGTVSDNIEKVYDFAVDGGKTVYNYVKDYTSEAVDIMKEIGPKESAKAIYNGVVKTGEDIVNATGDAARAVGDWFASWFD